VGPYFFKGVAIKKHDIPVVHDDVKGAVCTLNEVARIVVFIRVLPLVSDYVRGPIKEAYGVILEVEETVFIDKLKVFDWLLPRPFERGRFDKIRFNGPGERNCLSGRREGDVIGPS
jgi:hypothetical protein